MKRTLLTFALAIIAVANFSQGLDSIIVEQYHIATSEEASSDENLNEGDITYRIFVDMAAGYELQAVTSAENHNLIVGTSTEFYNTDIAGVTLGENISDLLMGFVPTLKYDSWWTIGAYKKDDGGQVGQQGVLLIEDPDGTVDGYMDGEAAYFTANSGFNFSMFNKTNSAGEFNTNGESQIIYVPGGIQGPTATNRVLIGQFTTGGDFYFELNIQVREVGTTNTTKYVARDAVGNEVQFPGLSYPTPIIQGCMSPTACNYNPDANLSNGYCIEPVENCRECNPDNTGLILIDTDGDGVCDANEIFGCTTEGACNYDPLATEDDGLCIIPEANCTKCNATNDGLDLIDSDGDGICDRDDNEEISGCTNPDACNYNELASIDDGSCLIPVPGCSFCSGDMLMIEDNNGNGIPDCEDIYGCTIPEACNYNPDATYAMNDGCIIPDECTQCNEDSTALEIIDENDDGIADCYIVGCTDPTACNYNDSANYDDGSCLVPASYCYECSEDSTELVMIDVDNDGIADCEDEGLEGLIVEVYYIADSADVADTDGGSLALGSVTYRVFVDMLPGYELQALFSMENQNLEIRTTTGFFNNTDRGESLGNSIPSLRIGDNTVALDSWLSMGAATNSHFGVLKSEDNDGSIVGGANNDNGLLVNVNEGMGIPLTTSDGLLLGQPELLPATSEMNLTHFGSENSIGDYNTNGKVSVLYVPGGVQGPTESNTLLIGQFTTDGAFGLKLNMSIRLRGTTNYKRYVASNAVGKDVFAEFLSYEVVPGCTNPDACNYNPDATLDNGTCLIPEENCTQCDGEELVLIDSDGDGICDKYDVTIVPIASKNLEMDVRIYPNPANQEMTIEISQIPDADIGHYSFTVLNMLGEALKIVPLKSENLHSIKTIIDVSDLKQGVYFIRLTTESGITVTRKFYK